MANFLSSVVYGFTLVYLILAVSIDRQSFLEDCFQEVDDKILEKDKIQDSYGHKALNRIGIETFSRIVK